MAQADQQTPVLYRIPAAGLQGMFDVLIAEGHQLLGPVLRDGAVAIDELSDSSQLPRGVTDEQCAGTYRVKHSDAPHLFAFNLGADSWKRYLFPSRDLLLELGPDLIATSAPRSAAQKFAFFGVRACDLAAVEVQARVFANTDDRYLRRLQASFIVGVHCQTAADTCFCPSMQTGPEFPPSEHLDLLLTEIVEESEHFFLAQAFSTHAASLLEDMACQAAQPQDASRIGNQLEQTRAQIQRSMPQSVAGLLADNLDAAHWDDVADRCLACGNCTAVCPTCFCSDVVEVTDVSADTSQRWQVWDSCFNASHSYTHGGTLRPSTRARYRQWLTHKLSTWHQQFGTSGCVGCGRCVTWCPVGIDLLDEVAAIAREAADVD
jgi:ferredoxin